MSLTDVMDDVDYATKNFNDVENGATVVQQPMHMTESHFVYHIQRNSESGQFSFIKDAEGEPLCSPRPLKQLSMQPMVVKNSRMKILKNKKVPAQLYPLLLTEAIFQRSLQTVTYLVSTWPLPELRVADVLPEEDNENFRQLTEPQEAGPGLLSGMSLCDAFMAGLLNLHPGAPLRMISFAGLGGRDRKLCLELLRLPILWVKPDHRDPEFIHSLLCQDIVISQEDVGRYLSRIGSIYSAVDRYVKHGKDIGPVTVEVDCRLCHEDVAMGLALQFKTPFNFRCPRVWMDTATEYQVPIPALAILLPAQHVTHLEIEDAGVSKTPSRWQDVNCTLPLLTSLQALSLPNTLHVDLLQESFKQFPETLSSLRCLRKLNLSSCNLKDNLGHVLQGLSRSMSGSGSEGQQGGITYLSLRDCRLSPEDVQKLLQWPQLPSLQELNLSRNTLQATPVGDLRGLVSKLSAHVTCLAMSYCSLSPPDLLQVAEACVQCPNLKVLALQGFTPPLPDDLTNLIHVVARIASLQRFVVFPESNYAFPGRQRSQRAANRASVGFLCVELLAEVGRPDIQLA